MPLARCCVVLLVFLATVAGAWGQAPDLSANFIGGPASVLAGQSAVFTIDVTNVGGTFLGPFTWEVRFSNNTTISPSDPLAGSGTSFTFGPQAVGITVPSTILAGTWFLGLYVQPAPGEANLSNNGITNSTIGMLPGTPDLAALTIVGPAMVMTGQTIGVTRDITNVGGALQSPFTYDVVLSTDATITAADTIVGTFNSTTFGFLSINVTVPSSLSSGPHFWGLIVHPEPGEISLANNQVAGTVTTVSNPNTPFAGSGEDLDLLTGVNGTPDAVTPKTASPGDVLFLQVFSPGGGFDGSPPVIAAQLYTTSPPFGIIGFPEVWLDPLGAFIVYSAASPTPLGFVVLQPGGITLPIVYPGSLSGTTARVQGFAITPAALNGVFAATDAREFTLQ